MTRILLCGCNGRMGQVITNLAKDFEDVMIVAGVDPFAGIKNTYPVYRRAEDVTENVDVIVDFSNPASLDSLLAYAKKSKAALIISTTGHTEEQKKQIEDASKTIPVFMSGNMSLGINLILSLVQQAARTLEGMFDIEIVEKHHNKKIDAPSGTALMIADSVNEALNNQYDYVYERESVREKRDQKEIGIHSIRGGTIVGEHSVIFAGTDEVIEIKHSALSREIFAVGALKAARFVKGRSPGFYNMKNVIQENI